MAGYQSYNFPEFDKAAKKLREQGHDVFSPAEFDIKDGFDPDKDPQKPFKHYMQIDLPEVMNSDGVVLLKGWEKSKGAKLEVKVAIECSIPVYELNDDYTDMKELKFEDIKARKDEPKEKEIHSKSKDDPFVLKDSGKRQEFSTGAIRDTSEGKGRYDLISPIATRRLAIVLEKGALKYSSRNWELGMNMSRLIDSAKRHIDQYLEGKKDEDHAGQAMFNIMALIHMEEMINREILPKELNDLPNYIKE